MNWDREAQALALERSSTCRRATGGMAEQRQGWQDWRHELRFIVCHVSGFAQPWGSPITHSVLSAAGGGVALSSAKERKAWAGCVN